MGNAVQWIIGLVRPAQRAGWAVFLASLLPLGCGGRSQNAADGGADSSGGSGGSLGGEGGAGSIFLGGSGVGGHDSTITFAGAPSAAGTAGARDACDENALWEAILYAVGGVGYCEMAPIPTPNEPTGLTRGTVTINEDGLVIDNTGLAPHEKKAWLDGLSNKRWTCLAGQTIGYKCRVAG